MPPADHPGDDLIQQGLDHRLDADGQVRLDDHLAICPECRGTWQALRWVKEQAARAPRVDLPESLGQRVRDALDAEDAATLDAHSRKPERWTSSRPIQVMAAALAVVAIAAVIFLTGRGGDLPSAVARDHAAFSAGRLTLELRTSDVSAMEAHLSRAGLPFPPRVLDLAMMKYRLVGGTVRQIDGRPSVLLAYQREDGHVMLCWMYIGSLDELPAPRERPQHDGIPFAVYERPPLTLVFWPEGNVVCVLSGEGGPTTLLPLAFAKAMRARVASGITP